MERLETRIIPGAAIARGILDEVRGEVLRLGLEGLPRPHLAVVIAGDDPASEIYVAEKIRAAASADILSTRHAFGRDATTQDILDIIHALNADAAVHGILVQLPLPAGVDRDRVIAAIDPVKDVDGFHPQNVGMLNSGHGGAHHVPCTPAGCMRLIRSVLGEDIAGLKAVVIGRSNIVGKPMLALLGAAEATVVSAHIKTRNVADLCRRADILVAAAGSPQLVRGDWIKPGAVVIDVGINRITRDTGERRIVGDVAFDECLGIAGAITPVPGGVGPMTIAMLMANTLQAVRMGQGRDRAAVAA